MIPIPMDSPVIRLLFLRQILPVAAGHVVELLAGVQTLTDADGFEIGAPEVLQQMVVAAEEVVGEFAVV